MSVVGLLRDVPQCLTTSDMMGCVMPVVRDFAKDVSIMRLAVEIVACVNPLPADDPLQLFKLQCELHRVVNLHFRNVDMVAHGLRCLFNLTEALNRAKVAIPQAKSVALAETAMQALGVATASAKAKAGHAGFWDNVGVVSVALSLAQSLSDSVATTRHLLDNNMLGVVQRALDTFADRPAVVIACVLCLHKWSWILFGRHLKDGFESKCAGRDEAGMRQLLDMYPTLARVMESHLQRSALVMVVLKLLTHTTFDLDYDCFDLVSPMIPWLGRLLGLASCTQDRDIALRALTCVCNICKAQQWRPASLLAVIESLAVGMRRCAWTFATDSVVQISVMACVDLTMQAWDMLLDDGVVAPAMPFPDSERLCTCVLGLCNVVLLLGDGYVDQKGHVCVGGDDAAVSVSASASASCTCMQDLHFVALSCIARAVNIQCRFGCPEPWRRELTMAPDTVAAAVGRYYNFEKFTHVLMCTGSNLASLDKARVLLKAIRNVPTKHLSPVCLKDLQATVGMYCV